MGLAVIGNSTPGTNRAAFSPAHWQRLSIDVDGHQQSCIFCGYQQETPSDQLESEQECGVGVEDGGQEDQPQEHMLAPLPGTVITVAEELARGWTS